MVGSVRERDLEHKLVRAVKGAGGLCIKFSCPSLDGMPDRICLFPCGTICFVEVKRRGMKPRPLQLARHEMLRRFGFKVYVLDEEKQMNVLKQFFTEFLFVRVAFMFDRKKVEFRYIAVSIKWGRS